MINYKQLMAEEIKKKKNAKQSRYAYRKKIWDQRSEDYNLPKEYLDLQEENKAINEDIKQLSALVIDLMKRKHANEIQSGKILFEFFKEKPKDTLFEYFPPTDEVFTRAQRLMTLYLVRKSIEIEYIPASYRFKQNGEFYKSY